MKIEKGNTYLCVRNVALKSSDDETNGKLCFIKNNKYKSVEDGYLIDEMGNDHGCPSHDGWTNRTFILDNGNTGLPQADGCCTNDPINPDHYKSYSVETIDMMVAIYGKEKVAIHCELNAFKYRMRMGKKKSETVDQVDGHFINCYKKEQWYLNKAKELRK